MQIPKPQSNELVSKEPASKTGAKRNSLAQNRRKTGQVKTRGTFEMVNPASPQNPHIAIPKMSTRWAESYV